MSDVARELAPGLWVLDHPLRMPGGIAIGTRSTAIRLADGGLWLHSPGPLTPAVRGWLAEHGPLRALVAPNLLHHLFLPETAAAFPEAVVWAPARLREKLPALPAHRVLGVDEAPWAGEIAALPVPGCPRLDEVAFCHAASRTLILVDLAFNMRHSGSARTRLFMRANGAWGRFGPTRLARVAIVRDREAVRGALEKILQWDFERVIVAHGEVLERGGREALRSGYAWLLR